MYTSKEYVPAKRTKVARLAQISAGLRCPECESTETESNGSSEYRCIECDHRWGFECGERYGF